MGRLTLARQAHRPHILVELDWMPQSEQSDVVDVVKIITREFLVQDHFAEPNYVALFLVLDVVHSYAHCEVRVVRPV